MIGCSEIPMDLGSVLGHLHPGLLVALKDDKNQMAGSEKITNHISNLFLFSFGQHPGAHDGPKYKQMVLNTNTTNYAKPSKNAKFHLWT